MNTRERQKAAIDQADQIVRLTMKDAEAYPNILGVILRGSLKELGWYSAKIDGVKTYFELVD